MSLDAELGSFRDRSSTVFFEAGFVRRRIHSDGIRDFNAFESSGLSRDLRERDLVVNYDTLTANEEEVVLQPQQLTSISYPYEWCFSQLKAAALLTLEIQERALAVDMSLKDATAYNVQFQGAQAIHIDTGSFEHLREGQPWPAYRQFCEHFLAPLLLMSRVDFAFSKLQRAYIDGIPLKAAAKAVPRKTWLNPWLNLHVRVHAKAKSQKSAVPSSRSNIPKTATLGLVNTLRSAVNALRWEANATEWATYSSADSYDDEASGHKHQLIRSYAEAGGELNLVWDLGANAGEFSRIFSKEEISTVSWDIDPNAVERNFAQAVRDNDRFLLPLVQDLTNPSPALGWAHSERKSFMRRSQPDLVLALALIHHLVIGNSVPMAMVAQFLSNLSPLLIIEFVNPEDARVQQLLSTRTETHPYSLSTFEESFSREFEIVRRDRIRGSQRELFLLRRLPQ